jgi:hypothetical protein
MEILDCNKDAKIFDKCPESCYTLITPMGSSHPAFSGQAVVKTERDFPAVGIKVQDHRIQCGGLFLCDILINYESPLCIPVV